MHMMVSLAVIWRQDTHFVCALKSHARSRTLKVSSAAELRLFLGLAGMVCYNSTESLFVDLSGLTRLFGG